MTIAGLSGAPGSVARQALAPEIRAARTGAAGVQTGRNGLRGVALAAALTAALALPLSPVSAHPHVFVEGGIDFVIQEGAVLDAVEVTWLFDEFETLVMLASSGLRLNTEGGLDAAGRQEVAQLQRDWPDSFGASVHLSAAGEAVALGPPREIDVRVREGRLAVTFTRDLATPVALHAQAVEAAFYEPTFFVSFSVIEASNLLGAAEGCSAALHRFEPDPDDVRLMSLLARLGREETPEIENVGAKFADRITLTCA